MPVNTPAKLTTVHGTLFKLEGSYGAGGSLSASTDGVLADEMPKFTPGYANKGDRPPPPGNTSSYQRKVPPSGKFVDFPFRHVPRGPNSAFSASVFFTFHNMLRACGMDAAVTVTGGLEKWTYTPTPGPTGYASGLASLYGYGELWPVTAILGNWKWGFKTGEEIPAFDFAFKGLLGTYSDTLPPAITYPNYAIDPPRVVVSPTLTLNSVTQATLRECSIDYGRDVSKARLDVLAGGHAGFAPGRRGAKVEVLVETPAIATQDFWALFEAATQFTWAFNIGATQYRDRMKWSGNAQIMEEPKREDDGAVALTRITLQCLPTTPTANDDIQLITD